MRTLSPGFTSLAVWAGAPATSSAARARASLMSSGSLAYRPDSKRMAWASTSTRSISGWMALILSIFRGVRERETREAILSPTFKSIFPARSSPISLTVPMNMPPEPVTGFCSLPRSATMSRIIPSVLARSRPHAS